MMLQAFGPNVMCLAVALLAAVGGGEAAFSEISCINVSEVDSAF
jgi:hypothetical protein